MSNLYSPYHLPDDAFESDVIYTGTEGEYVRAVIQSYAWYFFESGSATYVANRDSIVYSPKTDRYYTINEDNYKDTLDDINPTEPEDEMTLWPYLSSTDKALLENKHLADLETYYKFDLNKNYVSKIMKDGELVDYFTYDSKTRFATGLAVKEKFDDAIMIRIDENGYIDAYYSDNYRKELEVKIDDFIDELFSNYKTVEQTSYASYKKAFYNYEYGVRIFDEYFWLKESDSLVYLHNDEEINHYGDIEINLSLDESLYPREPEEDTEDDELTKRYKEAFNFYYNKFFNSKGFIHNDYAVDSATVTLKFDGKSLSGEYINKLFDKTETKGKYTITYNTQYVTGTENGIKVYYFVEITADDYNWPTNYKETITSMTLEDVLNRYKKEYYSLDNLPKRFKNSDIKFEGDPEGSMSVYFGDSYWNIHVDETNSFNDYIKYITSDNEINYSYNSTYISEIIVDDNYPDSIDDQIPEEQPEIEPVIWDPVSSEDRTKIKNLHIADLKKYVKFSVDKNLLVKKNVDGKEIDALAYDAKTGILKGTFVQMFFDDATAIKFDSDNNIIAYYDDLTSKKFNNYDSMEELISIIFERIPNLLQVPEDQLDELDEMISYKNAFDDYEYGVNLTGLYFWYKASDHLIYEALE